MRRALAGHDSLSFIARLFNWLPSLRSLWGHMIGIGPPPEQMSTYCRRSLLQA